MSVIDSAVVANPQALADAAFARATPDLLRALEPPARYAVAEGLLSWMRQLFPSQVKVRVFNPSREEHGWEGPFTVIEVLLSDRPFVVDSTLAELRRLGVGVLHLVHPVLLVSRDEAGNLLPLNARERHEAYELILVERMEDPARRGEVDAALGRVLNDVVRATDDFRQMTARTRRLAEFLRTVSQEDARFRGAAESATFLDWLIAGNFVFLGYREYDLDAWGEERCLRVATGSGLGILRDETHSRCHEPAPLSALPPHVTHRMFNARLLSVTKSGAEATVHRAARMDCVVVRTLDAAGATLGEARIFGLFTTQALTTPAREIPLLRRKLGRVLTLDGAMPGSHDYKQIVSIFDALPREELFWSDSRQLHADIRSLIATDGSTEVRLRLRPDPLGRGLLALVAMPRDRFSAAVRDAVQGLLTERLRAARTVEHHLSIDEELGQVRFHFLLDVPREGALPAISQLERDVARLTLSWDERLRARLAESGHDRLGGRCAGAFSASYQAEHDAAAAARDAVLLERLREERFVLYLLPPGPDGGTRIKLLHREAGLTLNQTVPMLEHLGLQVLAQASWSVASAVTGNGVSRGARIEVFRVVDRDQRPIDIARDGERLQRALLDLLEGRVEDDGLNALVLSAGLTARQASLLRSYRAYLGQVDPSSGRLLVDGALLAHPATAAALVSYFETRFRPDLEQREAEMARAREALLQSLEGVASLSEDRVLRRVLNLMEATVRTSWFLGRPLIAHKIRSADVAVMPLPRPMFEIFVTSPEVQGIHLRGGRVARGGIRWSDRPDDLRTEILGLMKTQMTKNALIVPVGSKGGFVVRRRPPADADPRAHALEQYRSFIRGLLDLTDNLREGHVVAPAAVVRHDADDPYLVVAADKGTAGFSDAANAVAEEYGFWLDDAFASGGTHGYDHKKEGITARGAWECVRRHFTEMGLDPDQATFTVAGIGDMSGDVFGNGLLYTRSIRLLAAFNHQHVFLDPDPDPEASWRERKRLFDLPRSTWADYRAEALSEGGGVFARNARAIPLSEQARAMLGIPSEEASGEEVVRAILRMPVDLLWNGGIGTYVRASFQSDGEVGDPVNDAVRVSASELRARVVGEGGNGGFTQLARVEYALGGGRINTDAIDNSGGVDLSDHEVNLKILFLHLLAAGALPREERDDVLRQVTDDVVALVLANNREQAACLSLAARECAEEPQLYASLVAHLAEEASLDTSVEHVLDRRLAQHPGRARQPLTRPELAVLLAYAKMDLYRRILASDLPDRPAAARWLKTYFPVPVRRRWPEAMAAHPLRREIIATQITNHLVNRLGMAFIHRLIRETGSGLGKAVLAALATLATVDGEEESS